MRLSPLVFVTIPLLFTACDQAPEVPPVDPNLGLTGGQLVYSETFDDPSSTDEWQSGYPGWKYEEGKLKVAGARNDALWLQTPLPEHFRLSFEATAHSETGDLKFEILGDGRTHESGYVGIFGGWNNSLNIIARLDEHGDDRLVGAGDQRVEPERTYTFTVVRTDQRLRWYVDGKPFLTYDDRAPLQGPGHRHFAFNNWLAPASFDNVEMYDLKEVVK
ncbi:hypothetical protein DL240_13685 [Lujinxingia litoralis]|uniref:Farnesoic acid O-methyl transferase domain-containing protein n=1 Tax=Lujinxingia litoralis TaxID=2211119 RepID=A0A328C8V9_9DELT|nr:hypothetical protein [Lujinxingia litoralis]RAL21179.1 hypothetical protein DL240_13685 [Lujinxingia litoralis]